MRKLYFQLPTKAIYNNIKVGHSHAKFHLSYFKSKETAKSGGFRYQWQIMKAMNIPDEEIKSFADTSHWLEYFPPHCKQDLIRMGLKVSQHLSIF